MSEENDTYEIGYGRPPRHTQFRKGISPNPSGRPKKIKQSQTDYEKELFRTHSVSIAGKAEKLASTTIIFKQLVKQAMTGDLRAIKMVLPIMQAVEAREMLERESQKQTKSRPDYSKLSTEELRQKLEDMILKNR